MPTLSKSRYVSGVQCAKKLYFDVHRKELKRDVSATQQALFDTGHALGTLAQQVFPNGRDVYAESNKNWSVAIELTKALIANNKQTIYEAAFSCNNGFAALDILHHTQGERWAIEVKSSTSVKDYQLDDAAFQYYVMDNAGYKPDKFFLMHIDNTYRKDGAIDPQQLFKLEDITALVVSKQAEVSTLHAALINVLDQSSEPAVSIGKHCDSPFACDYKYHCWAHIPSPSVFDLYNARGKDWTLYGQGISSMHDIPENFSLNHWQQLQVNGVKHNQTFLDKEKIEGFLGLIEEPLYFLDCETINSAIPILDGTAPFQQIPFQYSLHITDIEGNEIAHCEHLADASQFNASNAIDPRRLLIEQLKRDIGPVGSIVAYNAGFEVLRLTELAEAFPDERAYLESLISRFIDLLIPFRSGWYYHPDMLYGASIKHVLPAIAPEHSYNALTVSNGSEASTIFLSMIQKTFIGNEATTRNDLLEYCKKDSYGMVVLYRFLQQVIQ